MSSSEVETLNFYVKATTRVLDLSEAKRYV